MEAKADIGLIGLAVMGQNLVLKYGRSRVYRGCIQPDQQQSD